MKGNFKSFFKKNKEFVIVGICMAITIAVVIFYYLYGKSTNGLQINKKQQISSIDEQIIISNETSTNTSTSVSTEIGKKVNESTNASTNITTNTNKTDKNLSNNKTNTSSKNTTSNKNSENKSSANKTNTENKAESTEENKTEASNSFTMPVSGEIIKEFAKENLVYSKTLEEWVTHTGIDIKADKTTVVKSVANGTVKAIKNDPRYGLTVIVSHDNGFESIYSNLLTSEFVVEGEKIVQGQSIGTVGNTAVFEIADECHLHFELLKDSNYVDPCIYIK